MSQNLFNKVWDLHTVGTLPSGQTQLFIGLHLIHEVTSPQAFDMLRERELSVKYPERTFATVDHIVPTDNQARPFQDVLAEGMMSAIEKNCREFGVTLFDLDDDRQGIVHAVGPEQGLTQPGMTVACGDSHTSTHGAFGAIAFGIGTSQVAYVLATQTLAMGKPKVRRIVVNGELGEGVFAKDVILYIIRQLGVKGGIGYAYEYAGEVFDRMNDGRADDRLQHEHRRRCPLRIHQPGRNHRRVSEGSAARPRRRRVRESSRVVALARLRTGCRVSTTRWSSTRPTSSRRSPGASTRPSRLA